jgi:phosphoglycolate phosphatase-like HAD superfamily hydrolase
MLRPLIARRLYHSHTSKLFSVRVPEYFQPIKIVIFNVYGVLVKEDKHFLPAPTQAFLQMFKKYGVNIDNPSIENKMISTIEQYSGHSTREHISLMLEHAITASHVYEAIRDTDRKYIIDAMSACVENNLNELLSQPEYCKVDPYLLATVDNLKKLGVEHFVVDTGFSTSSYKITEGYLKKHGFVPDYVVCSDTIAKPIPSINGIYTILRGLGNYRPTQAIKIGANIVDIDEANRAGCVSIGLCDIYNKRQQMYHNNAQYVLSTLKDIPLILDPYNIASGSIRDWYYEQTIKNVDI